MTILHVDSSKAIAALTAYQSKQLPFATARALTRMAGLVSDFERLEMLKVFDRPTPFTLNSIYTLPATKAKLYSVVGIKDFTSKGSPAARYLYPEIFGGERAQKRSEFSITIKVHGQTIYMVPGPGLKLDQYGNVTRGRMTTILSALGASLDPLQNRTRRGGKSLTEYFIGSPGQGRPQGIWQRKGKKLLLLFIFTKRPVYRKRFDFFAVANKTVQAQWGRVFADSLKDALRTQR